MKRNRDFSSFRYKLKVVDNPKDKVVFEMPISDSVDIYVLDNTQFTLARIIETINFYIKRNINE